MPFDTNLDWACENKPGYLLLKTLSLVSSGGTRTGGQCPETVTLGSCVQIPRNPTQLRALMREDPIRSDRFGERRSTSERCFICRLSRLLSWISCFLRMI